MSKTSCATCQYSHRTNVGLECRAWPPASGEGRFGRWPGVRPSDFCHVVYRPADDEPPPAPASSRARRAQSDVPAEGKLL